ncbi:hypothetical protein ACQEK0_002172 [Escherichia coli]
MVWRYRYDADGLCTARVNGLEETILYSRDAAGRLAEVITPEGKTQYAYDKSGRLTGIFSPDGTSQRTGYDERGRVNVTTQGRRAIAVNTSTYLSQMVNAGQGNVIWAACTEFF